MTTEINLSRFNWLLPTSVDVVRCFFVVFADCCCELARIGRSKRDFTWAFLIYMLAEAPLFLLKSSFNNLDCNCYFKSPFESSMSACDFVDFGTIDLTI